MLTYHFELKSLCDFAASREKVTIPKSDGLKPSDLFFSLRFCAFAGKSFFAKF